MTTLKEQLAKIPVGVYEGTRYDTDDEHVLHLVSENVKAYDLRVKKE